MTGDAGSADMTRARNTETLALSRDVYDLAGRIWDLEPWTFMDETDLFGVEEPVTKQLGFISVMGALGEHRAVAVYLGAKGLYDFLSLQTASGDLSPSRFLDMPQVQLSFEKRTLLEAEDRQLLRQLGVGAMDGLWPQVRAYRPACMPWFAEPDELRLLRAALMQLVAMASRIDADPTCLRPREGTGILVRSISGSGRDAAWQETFVAVARPEPPHITVRIDPDLIDDVRDLPDADIILEIDCFRTETVIAEPGKRPHFPYALMICDSSSGLILHVNLLDPTPSLNDMWAAVPALIAGQIVKLGSIPKEIRATDPLLAQLLELVAPGFGFTVARPRRMPALQHAKAALLQNLGGPTPRVPRKKPKKR